MKVCFVLKRPELCGGVKVVFQLAELLRRCGHVAEVIGEGKIPDWARRIFGGDYRDYTACDTEGERGQFDFAIGTYYTTLELAEQLGAKSTVHFCQGFEGDLEHLRAERHQIEEVYRRPFPVITVNPFLGRRLSQQFGKEWYFIPPPVDSEFTPKLRFRPRRCPVIAIPGIFEAPVKGVKQCVDTIKLLRSGGWDVKTVRFSTMPRCDAERDAHSPEAYFHGISPDNLARELRGCDLLLFGSMPGEGFGLPVLEAALSGVPVVGNDLPSLRLVGVGRSERVELGSAPLMAGAAADLLRDPRLWRQTRRRLMKAARARFGAASVTRRLESALLKLKGEDF